MDKRQRERLVQLMGTSIQFDHPMATHTTFGVGGRADVFCEIGDKEKLQDLIAYLHKEGIPYLVVGGGSNLLITDNGIEGVVLRLTGELAVIQCQCPSAGDKTMDNKFPVVTVGGGLNIPDLLTYCRYHGLGGLEFLAGVPGTIGGAIAMNAGAFGKETGSLIQEVHLVTRHGSLTVMERSRLRFGYRRFDMEQGDIIIGASIQLSREKKENVARRITDYLMRRKKTQPLEYPSGGSVFRNPPDNYAARLIEKAGLKGKRIGGAMVSTKHANFIVNTGSATAKDIIDLITLVRSRVKEETDIELSPEIRLIGR